jgi:hypothetical protein
MRAAVITASVPLQTKRRRSMAGVLRTIFSASSYSASVESP